MLEPAKFRAAHLPNGIGLQTSCRTSECFQLVEVLLGVWGNNNDTIKGGDPWRAHQAIGSKMTVLSWSCIHDGYRIVIKLSQLPICISALTRPWDYLYLIHRVSFLWLGTSTHRNKGWRGPRDESAHHDSEKSIDQCVWFSRWVSRL